MPLDPSISLGINVPQPQPQGGPLGLLGSFATIQNALNQNQLFRQTFAARQRIGQILSASSDLESGIKSIFSDPQAAAFGGPVIDEIRQMQALQYQMARTRTETEQGVLSGTLRAAMTAQNPQEFNSISRAYLGSVDPLYRGDVAGSLDDVRQYLFDGEPTPAAIDARRAGMLIGAGGKDLLASVFGSPTVQPVMGGQQPGLQLPAVPLGAAQAGMPGGSFVPSGPTLPGLVKTPSGAEIPTQGGSLAPPAASAAPPLAADGRPLWSAPLAGRAPIEGLGLGGIPVMTESQQQNANELNKQFNSDDLKQFQSAQGVLASLKYMNSAFDNLARGGGFQVPGALAGARGDFARGVNTLYQMLGKDPPFDPTKVASWEEMNKETKRMGLQVINQFLGGGREAAMIVQGVTQSVPGADNSYLGGKLVAAGIGAGAQWLIDKRQFENEWRNQNYGNLTGATEAFQREHTPEAYAQQVLQQFGLTEKGFASPEAVRSALQQGYLTTTQARSILQQQFGMK